MKLNKMNVTRAYVVIGLAASVALLGLLGSNVAQAREPFTQAELKQQEDDLLKSVNRGRDLWHGSKSSMSNNGLACGNCHPDAAASNPTTFPKYQADLGKVAPLRDMINWCIMVPQQGQALDVDGDDMIAMEAYAYYMYRGKPLEPGLATEQTTPVVVKSGRGFPWKGSGIGYDK